MSPKTWMRTVYFERYLKLDILARLSVVCLTFFENCIQFRAKKCLMNFFGAFFSKNTIKREN